MIRLRFLMSVLEWPSILAAPAGLALLACGMDVGWLLMGMFLCLMCLRSLLGSTGWDTETGIGGGMAAFAVGGYMAGQGSWLVGVGLLCCVLGVLAFLRSVMLILGWWPAPRDHEDG